MIEFSGYLEEANYLDVGNPDKDAVYLAASTNNGDFSEKNIGVNCNI